MDVPVVVGAALVVSATILLPLWLFARAVMRPKRRRQARNDFPRVSRSRWKYFGSNAVLLILLVMLLAGLGMLFVVGDGA